MLNQATYVSFYHSMTCELRVMLIQQPNVLGRLNISTKEHVLQLLVFTQSETVHMTSRKVLLCGLPVNALSTSISSWASSSALIAARVSLGGGASSGMSGSSDRCRLPSLGASLKPLRILLRGIKGILSSSCSCAFGPSPVTGAFPSGKSAEATLPVGSLKLK